jgi:hypothetical protein
VLQVDITSGSVVITDLTCHDPETVQFFAEAPDTARPDLACRALSLGITGLRAMGVAGHVEVVEREFGKLTQRFDAALASVQHSLTQEINTTFDPARAESVSARMAASITTVHNAASRVVTEAQTELAQLVADSFNPDLATSCVYRIAKLITDTTASLDRAFDPAYEGSHLAKLNQTVDAYFGSDGALAELVAAQITPVKAELLTALQGVRELVVGQAMAAEERRRSPASGIDFEDDVYAVLCRLAGAYGDSVDRVGSVAGDAGRSKRGDFVVQLADGSRFVVEAKKRSTPLPLRGDRGVLAMLEDSLVNRTATFAIAVGRDENVFAKEVGAFNDYDGNKVLCRFGGAGELLEVAYRWARTALLATKATTTGLDLDEVAGDLDEARRALRELGRIEGKAKSIAQSADDIQSLISLQVRRIVNALDKAAAGLTSDAMGLGA